MIFPARDKTKASSSQGGIAVDVRQRVEQCMQDCRHSADGLRQAARDTDNNQARNAFIESAQKIEECIVQCQAALNQFK